MPPLSFGDRAGRLIWRLLPKRALSGAIGWGGRRPLPRGVRVAVLRRFAARFGIDLSEAEKELADYSGIDELFTRRLRPGARPVDPSPDAIVNPADGTLVESGLAAAGKLIQAKGVPFTLAELLLDEELARRLTDGAYLITYLSPRDYHRVHAPVAGQVSGWCHIPGTLFSVSAPGVRREPGLFVRNERFVTVLESDAGACAVVMVAAVGVGHITAAYDRDVRTHAGDFGGGLRRKKLEDGPALERGEELGTFHLGSTTVTIFEPGRASLDPLAAGAVLRMGARIGCIRRAP